VVDITFSSDDVDDHNVVIDIGAAHDNAKKVLAKLNYQNLDEIPEFKGKLTTTEFVAKYIHNEIRIAVASIFSGTIKVTLRSKGVNYAAGKGTYL